MPIQKTLTFTEISQIFPVNRDAVKYAMRTGRLKKMKNPGEFDEFKTSDVRQWYHATHAEFISTAQVKEFFGFGRRAILNAAHKGEIPKPTKNRFGHFQWQRKSIATLRKKRSLGF